ncbi:MAG: hypothetical protein HY785_28380 [Oscillatoriophycideae cyanobacterium NC_groundwater_1537_Pr4_S-0.65um_50_18]|nr:hypothetical protein [Oscillatoriophycideae cyanobacterium NC_groundwater_1537_Pr4_S-0.65um_50_18]
MIRTLTSTTTVFLALLAVTAALWVLRGLGLLTFLPGGLLWLLILLTIGAGVVSGLQWTKR